MNVLFTIHITYSQNYLNALARTITEKTTPGMKIIISSS